MSSPLTHPDSGQLLLYADGILRDSAAGVKAHLEGCAECRDWLAEVEQGSSAYAALAHTQWKLAHPAPPLAWPDIRQQLRPSTSLDAEHVHSRRKPSFRVPARLATAAAGILVALLVWRVAGGRSLSAAELLAKASARQVNSATPRHIQIRTRTATITRSAVLKTPVVRAGSDPRAEQLEALFRDANFSWEDPLNARSFAAWRDSVPDARDEVKRRDDTYEIHTTSATGALAQATIVLRGDELRPVREILKFRNDEQVEIVETERPANAIEPRTPMNAPPIAGGVSAAGPGASEELRAMAALHDAGADLGEPFEIRRLADRLEVVGLGIPSARRQEIRAALEGLPYVAVRFEEPQPAREAGESRDVPETAAVSPLQRMLEGRLGGRAAVSNLVDRTLDLTEASLARVHALRLLAERFPAAVEAQLGPADAAILNRLVRAHTSGLHMKSEQLRHILGQAFGEIEATRAAVSTPWQASIPDLVRRTQMLDQMLSRGLAGSGPDVTSESIRSTVAQWSGDVRALRELR